MSARFEPCELVDLVLKGARVVTGGDPSLEVTYQARGEAYALYIQPDAAGLTVTRVAPAEWPPQPGDVWADSTNEMWLGRVSDGDVYLASAVREASYDPDFVLRDHGPVRLEYRKGWTPAPAADVDQADEAKPEPEPLDERAAKIAGLREMADWLDAHPDLPLRKYTSGLVLSHFIDDHDELERLAALFGVDADSRTDNPHPGNPHRYARMTFSGGVKIEAVVCNAYPAPVPAGVDDPPAPAGTPDVAPPAGEAVADVAAPATAPVTSSFQLDPVPDADGDLIAAALDQFGVAMTGPEDVADNTVNSLDEETEHAARALGDDVSLLLDGHNIEHEVHVEHDGDDGWYVIITAGHKVHGDVLREFTLTYATAGQRWTWQATSEDGEREGPHEEASLAGASPVEIAEHIAANVAEA